MEEKELISYQVTFEEKNGGGNSGVHWAPFFRPPGRFERFKLALAAGLGLLVFSAVLFTFFFVGLILSIPVLLLGLFGYWRMGRKVRRPFGPSGF